MERVTYCTPRGRNLKCQFMISKDVNRHGHISYSSVFCIFCNKWSIVVEALIQC